jgi:hypothetical protein
MAVYKDGVLLTTLHITQGADWDRIFTLTNPATGDPLDLTGYELTGAVRYRPDDVVALYEWSTANGNVSVSNDGKATISVPRATSLAWTWVDSQAYYDVFIKNTSNKRVCIARGQIKVIKAMTRSA